MIGIAGNATDVPVLDMEHHQGRRTWGYLGPQMAFHIRTNSVPGGMR
jgi:hypothetical protein